MSGPAMGGSYLHLHLDGDPGPQRGQHQPYGHQAMAAQHLPAGIRLPSLGPFSSHLYK